MNSHQVCDTVGQVAQGDEWYPVCGRCLAVSLSGGLALPPGLQLEVFGPEVAQLGVELHCVRCGSHWIEPYGSEGWFAVTVDDVTDGCDRYLGRESPWQLVELDRGRLQYVEAKLKRLALPQRALVNWGAWPAAVEPDYLEVLEPSRLPIPVTREPLKPVRSHSRGQRTGSRCLFT